ncbi:hypothetical protein Droror1_Dr00018513 [Drosera rotundifolia]
MLSARSPQSPLSSFKHCASPFPFLFFLLRRRRPPPPSSSAAVPIASVAALPLPRRPPKIQKLGFRNPSTVLFSTVSAHEFCYYSFFDFSEIRQVIDDN